MHAGASNNEKYYNEVCYKTLQYHMNNSYHVSTHTVVAMYVQNS